MSRQHVTGILRSFETPFQKVGTAGSPSQFLPKYLLMHSPVHLCNFKFYFNSFIVFSFLLFCLFICINAFASASDSNLNHVTSLLGQRRKRPQGASFIIPVLCIVKAYLNAFPHICRYAFVRCALTIRLHDNTFFPFTL